MPAAKQYVVLHDFSTRVNEKTGAEKTFKAGDDYDGPPERVEQLLAGVDFHGPLIAVKKAESPAAPTEGK